MDIIRRILQVKGPYVLTVSPDETVFEALRLMAIKDVGALVVMQGENLVGLISERDYARKVILRGRSSRDTLVREIMTFPVETVHPDQTIEECMDLMVNRRVRQLPVIENGQLVGLISMGDLLNYIIYMQRRMITELEERVKESEKPEAPEPVVPRFPSTPLK
jgi:CBS domain-containing protein